MFQFLFFYLTKCFKKMSKYKGNYKEGLYNKNDSKDETELVSFLSDTNIIHPFVEETFVIFNNNPSIEYIKLDTISNNPYDSDDSDDFKDVDEENTTDDNEDNDII